FIHGTLYSGFHMLVGGKMGSGGFTIASNLDWFLEPDQAHDVVIEIVKLFRDEGARGARTQCRLAFLLEEWGLDRFRQELVQRLGWQPAPAGKDARSDGHNDHFGVRRQKQPGLYSVGLRVSVGRISHGSLAELGRLADVYGNGSIRLTTGQNAILVNIPEERLDALLGEPLLRELMNWLALDCCGVAQLFPISFPRRHGKFAAITSPSRSRSSKSPNPIAAEVPSSYSTPSTNPLNTCHRFAL